MSKTLQATENRLRHVAFIMDGNGRWAKKRGMPREYGHRFGVKTFRAILDHCNEMGLDAVTFYAFSTENWKRPKKEVNAILRLMDAYLKECEEKIDDYDLRICFLGDKSAFSEDFQRRMVYLEEKSAARRRVLNIALNYGGRDEIVHACNKLIAAGEKEITKEALQAALYTGDCPEPDLIIRTGGELRISNFLLWQAAYAELYFTDVLWPDFTPEDLDAAIAEYHSRKRRYGGV